MASSRNGQRDSGLLSINGHKLRVTHPDKVLYPQSGTTKAEVLEYYSAVADTMVRYTAMRPATRKRWVNGVGTAEKPGQVFFQKNLDDSAPEWIARQRLQHKDHVNIYPLANDRATLMWFAQTAALEIHVPQWQFDAEGQPKNPDRLVLDLDPGEGATLNDCAEVAKLARPILQDLGIDTFPLTSGSKGIHLYGTLDGKHSSDQISALAHELARSLEADHPELVVSDMKKVQRRGKVLLDWSQNSAAKTTVAPYSLRGKAQPWVSAPRAWPELEKAELSQLTFEEVLARLEADGDLLDGLASASSGSDQPAHRLDKLEKYRAKRDRAKTPEPIPETAEAPALQNGSSFVIQEHHARNLHYDFRLEHEGVLVSWALPKGVPTSTRKNHLAVQTEDHPLSYAGFEGSIPKGEYGGGEVAIWDSGSFELEKWREDEIIVTLHGRENGALSELAASNTDFSSKFALIRTSSEAEDRQNWLIHLMKPKPARRGSERAVEKQQLSELRPMLATPLGIDDFLRKDDFSDQRKWVFDSKWDGIRALCQINDGGVRLTSRNGKDLTPEFPEFSGLASQLDAEQAVLDGEIVALTSEGVSNFGLLQSRGNPGSSGRPPLWYIAFDLLQLAGRDLTGLTFSQRWELLENALHPDEKNLLLSKLLSGSPETVLNQGRKSKLEGVIAKAADSRYQSGQRSADWLKIKFQRSQEVIVIGWRTGKGARASTFGSLLLAVPQDGKLSYAGRVGTGFTSKNLQTIQKRLDRHPRKTAPVPDVPAADATDAHWIRPQFVAEVSFTEWTAEGRLRHPAWRGWREDKAADEVTVE